HAVQSSYRAQGARREESGRLLHARGAFRRRGGADSDVGVGRDRGLRHDPADGGGGSLLLNPYLVLAPTLARDDDARLERGVGEVTLHRVAAEAGTGRAAGRPGDGSIPRKELYFK